MPSRRSVRDFKRTETRYFKRCSECSREFRCSYDGQQPPFTCSLACSGERGKRLGIASDFKAGWTADPAGDNPTVRRDRGAVYV